MSPQLSVAKREPRTAVAKTAPQPVVQCKCACGSNISSVASECEECKKKVQRSTSNGAAPALAPPIVHEVLKSPGQPLDKETRAFMEPRFGHDFGKVRVHTDEHAAKSARGVNALAYTVGNHVIFGSGQYSPQSAPGQSLIAHELTHTIQQQPLAGSSPNSLEVEAGHSPSEAVADDCATEAMSNGLPPSSAQVGPPQAVMRMEKATQVSRIARRAAAGTTLLQRQQDAPGKKQPEVSPRAQGLSSRVHDIDLKTKSKPSKAEVKPDPENPGILRLTVDSPLSFEAQALVNAPTDCKDISFGFIQLCRPYSLFRAVYKSLSGGDDLEVDPSAKIRAKEPVLDVANVGDTFYKRIPVICAQPEPDKQMVGLFSDKPAHFFKMSIDSDHYLAGVAAHDFFFTTLTVLLPGQPPQHMKSFYWDIKHCEGFGPPPGGSPPGTVGSTTLKTSAVGVGDPIDGAPAEPGIEKMGKPSDKICKDAVNDEITSSYSKPNRGKVTFGC